MNKPRSTHTRFTKGAKIRIILRDGRVIIAKYIETIGHHRGLRTDKGDFPTVSLRSANYYKPLPNELK